MRELWTNIRAAMTSAVVARKALIAGVVSAALGGAIDQIVSLAATGSFDTAHLKMAMIVGASAGVSGYLHPAPKPQ